GPPIHADGPESPGTILDDRTGIAPGDRDRVPETRDRNLLSAPNPPKRKLRRKRKNAGLRRSARRFSLDQPSRWTTQATPPAAATEMTVHIPILRTSRLQATIGSTNFFSLLRCLRAIFAPNLPLSHPTDKRWRNCARAPRPPRSSGPLLPPAA